MALADLGDGVRVDPGAVVGYEYDSGVSPAVVGDHSTIRTGTVVYADAVLGAELSTGHGALVREHTTVGDRVTVGTQTVLDGHLTVGSDVSIQTGVYVPPETEIGDAVFLGPGAVLTNDRYPLRVDDGLDGPTLCDHVSVGANATVLPGVTVGAGAFVAAGSVVTVDVPPETLAVGAPAEHRPLPEHLDPENAPA